MDPALAPGARVVVAMSGGVDSSTVAALLTERGCNVVGVTLQLYNHSQAIGHKGACCAGQDIYDAARVAEMLRIPHYVLDYERRFRTEVIDDFADSYLAGETPVPCIRCNETVKFQDLLDVARDLGAEALATGHYARRVEGLGGPELHCAADSGRDQSYFLYRTTRAQLSFVRFPLGECSKNDTRTLAARLGLPVAQKPDSQDICFVPNGRYATFIEKLRPGAVEPGEIVDETGRVLGEHNGINHFTVGQRKGLAVAGDKPLYVLRLEPTTRQVVVGPRARLAATRVTFDRVNWLAPHPAESGVRVSVKLRSAQLPARATLRLDGGQGTVMLDEPAYGVAPGQACVAYDGDRLLGGGRIAHT